MSRYIGEIGGVAEVENGNNSVITVNNCPEEAHNAPLTLHLSQRAGISDFQHPRTGIHTLRGEYPLPYWFYRVLSSVSHRYFSEKSRK